MIICEVNRIDNRKMIYLDDAIDAVEKESQIDGAYGYMDTKSIVDLLNNLPSAQPQRMRGRWKRTYLDHEAMGERPSIFYCSACNQCIAYPTNYCPSCGADMRGEADGR